MNVKHRVETLAKDAVVTTVSAARHPLNSAAWMTGLAKGSASAGIGLVRDVVRGPVETAETVVAAPEPSTPAAHSARSAPGPDVVPKPVPTYDELPEPIVISAEDETPDPVHTEPKAASRASAHGGSVGDREEADGYREEIEDEPGL